MVQNLPQNGSVHQEEKCPDTPQLYTMKLDEGQI